MWFCVLPGAYGFRILRLVYYLKLRLLVLFPKEYCDYPYLVVIMFFSWLAFASTFIVSHCLPSLSLSLSL